MTKIQSTGYNISIYQLTDRYRGPFPKIHPGVQLVLSGSTIEVLRVQSQSDAIW